MLLYWHLHDVNAVDYSGPINTVEVFTGSYDDVIDTITSVGAYAELVHIHAISAALGVVIKFYYAPVNGLCKSVLVHNMRPWCAWSTFTRPTNSQRFHLNQFVLLLERNVTPEPDSISDVSDVDVAVTAAVFHQHKGVEHAILTDNSELQQDSSDSETSSVEFQATQPLATENDTPVADNKC